MPVVQEGAEPLPHCDLCVIHMPVGWIIKHWKTQICDKNNHLKWRRRDMYIARQCAEVTSRITGEYGAEII